MLRPDLLALTLDDLIALTNRGVVKRAARELEAGQVTGEIAAGGDGDLVFRWSDGRTSTLPAGRTLSEGACDCAALGLCRCLVRAVLAYQQHVASGTTKPTEPSPLPKFAADSPTVATWDPGQISDDTLGQHFSAKALAKARRLWREGQWIELARGAKPTAHFHLRSTTLRFLVPGDPRYVVCDCGEAAPCGCVPLAVWAFRQLPAEQAGGLISTGETQYPVPEALLADIEQQLTTLATLGLERFPSAGRDRLARAEAACRAEGLIWPAEIVAELLELARQYREHDAQFESRELARLMGELLIRSDAIRTQPAAVPQPLIRGTREDRLAEIGSARLLGLGCGATIRQHSVELAAYLQDATSGTVLAITRSFAHGGHTPSPPSIGQLASQAAIRGLSLAEIGVGNLLIKAGKRSPSRRLVLGRASLAIEPESFAWETLRPPLLVEEFAALEAQWKLLPPSSLRPRRVTAGLHVLQIADLVEPAYDPARQVIEAKLIDARGDAMRLTHPYTSLGRVGFESLLQALTRAPRQVKFVAGMVRSEAGGMTVSPTCVVFDTAPGRLGLQPWASEGVESLILARDPQALSANLPELLNDAASLGMAADVSRPSDSQANWPAELFDAVGELLLVGARTGDAGLPERWRELAERGEAQGYDRLPRLARNLAAELERKQHSARWEAQPAADLALRLAVILRLAQDRW